MSLVVCPVCRNEYETSEPCGKLVVKARKASAKGGAASKRKLSKAQARKMATQRWGAHKLAKLGERERTWIAEGNNG